MKVFFVYASPRTQIFQKDNFHANMRASLFGLDHMTEFSIEANYSDEGFKRGALTIILDFLCRIFRNTANFPAVLSQPIVLRKELNKTDVIFTTAYHCGIPVVILKYLGIIKKPVVLVSMGFPEHLEAVKDRFIFKLYQKVSKRIDKIICYGWREKEKLQEYLNIPPKKLCFIPFGVDVEYFKPNSTKVENFALSIGADPQRDYRTLFEAVTGLKMNLILITFQRNIEGLSIPKNVKVYFEVPFRCIKEFYSKSRFVILPLKENSYSGATTCLLQAMAMRKVAIVSKTQAIENGYNLFNGNNCILVTPGDAKEMQKAISYLLNNPKEMVRIGSNARRTVEKWHTWHRYVGNLAQIFAEVHLQDEDFDHNTAL